MSYSSQKNSTSLKSIYLFSFSAFQLFEDYTNFNDGGYVPYFGGNFNDRSNAGAFQLNVNYNTDNYNDNIGGHQMFNIDDKL